MDALATDARGQQLVELRREPEPTRSASPEPMCPLALVVVVHRGRVLLGSNRWRRAWELPGGLVEVGETPRAAARRELVEETGLAVEPRELSWCGLAVFDLVDPVRRELAAVYALVLERPPSVVASYELVALTWSDPGDPPADCAPLDLALVRTVLVSGRRG